MLPFSIPPFESWDNVKDCMVFPSLEYFKSISLLCGKTPTVTECTGAFIDPRELKVYVDHSS